MSTKMSLYCHSILLKNEQKFAKIHKRPRAGKSEKGLKIKGFQGFRGNGEIITTMFPKPLRRVRLPYPAPKKKRRLSASLLFWNPWDIEKHRGQVNCPCANAFAEQKHFTAQKRRASTRRSASRLDSNYLTAEVNSAYNNSPLRCELTRDFARGTRGTLKCSGEVNSLCANAFAQQKHFTAQKRQGERSG